MKLKVFYGKIEMSSFCLSACFVRLVDISRVFLEAIFIVVAGVIVYFCNTNVPDPNIFYLFQA